MQPDYKNWVPKGMAYGLAAGTVALAGGAVVAWTAGKALTKTVRIATRVGVTAGLAVCGAFTAWSFAARNRFSYDGKRQLSKAIIEGTAEYVTLPEGGVCLDVGCGSGALAIAVAKHNPQAKVIGVDRWGAEYASFTKELCESNARAEGLTNVTFERGDACELAFADENFDAVVSNYVYHNITGVNKQELLRETLRTLKKGGVFAIHDLMGPARYGDMEAFCDELRAEGYEEVELIPTADGLFMDKTEATLMMLADSMLLVGKK